MRRRDTRVWMGTGGGQDQRRRDNAESAMRTSHVDRGRQIDARKRQLLPFAIEFRKSPFDFVLASFDSRSSIASTGDSGFKTFRST